MDSDSPGPYKRRADSEGEMDEEDNRGTLIKLWLLYM